MAAVGQKYVEMESGEVVTEACFADNIFLLSIARQICCALLSQSDSQLTREYSCFNLLKKNNLQDGPVHPTVESGDYNAAASDVILPAGFGAN